MQIKILHNQTLLDIAIQQYGSATMAIDLAIENNLSLTDDLEVGTVLNVPENSDFGQRLIAEYFQNKSLKPATKIVGKILESIPVDFGIGEMIIEESFIIR